MKFVFVILLFTSKLKSLPGNFLMISLKKRAGKTMDPVDSTFKSSLTGILISMEISVSLPS